MMNTSVHKLTGICSIFVLFFFYISGYFSSIDALNAQNNSTKAFAFDSGIPYFKQSYSFPVNHSLIVLDGAMLSHHFEGPEIKWKPWGGIDNTLGIKTSMLDNSNIPLMTLSGNATNSSVGFVSNDLSYHGKYVSLVTGKIEKDSMTQLSFALGVIGNSGREYQLIFVNGFLNTVGWTGSYRYDNVGQFSSKLIDLEQYIDTQNDTYNFLKKVTVVVQKGSDIDEAQFKINLGKTTTNTPVLLSGNEDYFVVGNVSTLPIMEGGSYILHNLFIYRLEKVSFPIVSTTASLVTNGWDILKTDQYHVNNNIFHRITATKALDADLLNPLIIGKLDLMASIINLSAKDILFILIGSLGVGLLYANRWQEEERSIQDRKKGKNIIMITPSRFPGTAGDTANYTEIMMALARKGFAILVICPKSNPAVENISLHANVHIKRIPCSPPRLNNIKNGIAPDHFVKFLVFSIEQWFTILGELMRNRRRSVYMRHGILTFGVPYLLRLFGLKIVADGELFSEDLNFLTHRPLFAKMIELYERNTVSYYSYFRVSTESQAKRMVSWGFPPQKIFQLPMSININQIPIVPLEQVPQNTFGFFGALEEWQGPQILLEAFQIVLKKIPTAILYIIGDGSLRHHLKDYVEKNNLSTNVIFEKGVSRLKIWHFYFKKFQIVVIPRPRQSSSFDSLPSIKLIEALAGGKPAIVTDIEAMKEIPDGVIIVVPSNDPTALASAMCTLSFDSIKMHALSDAALKYVKQHDISVTIERLIQVFYRLS